MSVKAALAHRLPAGSLARAPNSGIGRRAAGTS